MDEGLVKALTDEDVFRSASTCQPIGFQQPETEWLERNETSL